MLRVSSSSYSDFKGDIIKPFIFFILILAFVAIVAFGYLGGWLRFNYPEKSQYPVHGIDVSHHQGDIDWSAIPKEKISFVYIKATEGGDWRDKNFLENWNGMRQAGFETGAYHFFTLCRDGLTQARNFMEFVPAVGDSLPPVIDLEYVGNCSKRPSRDEFLQELNDFIQEWQVTYMKKPVLYTTHEFYRDYLQGSDYADYPLWIRDIFHTPSLSDYPSMILWQYADNARISGIDGPVDLNARITP